MRTKKEIFDDHSAAIDKLKPTIEVKEFLLADSLEMLVDIRDFLEKIADAGEKITRQLERIADHGM